MSQIGKLSPNFSFKPSLLGDPFARTIILLSLRGLLWAWRNFEPCFLLFLKTHSGVMQLKTKNYSLLIRLGLIRVCASIAFMPHRVGVSVVASPYKTWLEYHLPSNQILPPRHCWVTSEHTHTHTLTCDDACSLKHGSHMWVEGMWSTPISGHENENTTCSFIFHRVH